MGTCLSVKPSLRMHSACGPGRGALAARTYRMPAELAEIVDSRLLRSISQQHIRLDITGTGRLAVVVRHVCSKLQSMMHRVAQGFATSCLLGVRSGARTNVGIGRNNESCLIGKSRPDFVSHTTCSVRTCIYSTNVFLVEVSSRKYLDTALSWLDAIGEVNVDRLRHLKLCGWTTRALRHRTLRKWETILLDLKERRMKMRISETLPRDRELMVPVVSLGGSLSVCTAAREGRSFDTESLVDSMSRFDAMCESQFRHSDQEPGFYVPGPLLRLTACEKSTEIIHGWLTLLREIRRQTVDLT